MTKSGFAFWVVRYQSGQVKNEWVHAGHRDKIYVFLQLRQMLLSQMLLAATLSDDTQVYVSETEDFHISYHHTDTAANAVGGHLSADKPPESVTHFLRLIPKVTTRAAASFISLRSKSRRVSIQ